MAAAAQTQDRASTAVAKTDSRQPPVISALQKMEGEFALALPEHVSAERFVRVVQTAINSSPELLKADRTSVLAAAMKCAQDGLLPDGKEAALVVYGGKAQYLPMIAGVLTKVRRSGELLSITAHVVYEKDVFSYVLGDDERIEHVPFIGQRGKPIAVYAIAITKDDGVYREVMSIEEVEKVRNVSKAKNNGPWVQWWSEMARKTVLRRLAKRLPMSTDLQQVFQRDDDHYDLSRAAQGAATMRRLHADFEEPTDEIPADEDHVIDGESHEVGEGEFPGDRKSELEVWADGVLEQLDQFPDAEALNAFTDELENIARFEALVASHPTAAKKLEAAINGRRKALLSRGAR